MPEPECGRRGSRRDAELAKDVLEMSARRVVADDQRRPRSARLLLPGCDQTQHLQLARGQAVASCRAVRAGASESTRTRSGAAPSCAKTPRAASSSSAAVSSSPSAGRPGPPARGHARPRTAPRAPATPAMRAAQRDQRRLGVALGQRDRAARVRGHRNQRVAPLTLRDLARALGRRCRASLDLADREHDLDVGGQQSRALEWLCRLAHRAADRCGCGIAVALRKPEEGEARLRLATRAGSPPGRPPPPRRARPEDDGPLPVGSSAARSAS